MDSSAGGIEMTTYKAKDEVVPLTFNSAHMLGELRRNRLGQHWRLLIVQVDDDGRHEAVTIYGNDMLRMLRNKLNDLDYSTEEDEA
jgi:hypothetical protein